MLLTKPPWLQQNPAPNRLVLKNNNGRLRSDIWDAEGGLVHQKLLFVPPSPRFPSVCPLGPGSYPCPLLMCHSHRQEPLELFCESCDLLCCSSCHLSSHKNHRSVCRHTRTLHGGANRRSPTWCEQQPSLPALSLPTCICIRYPWPASDLIMHSCDFVFWDVSLQ